MKEKSKKRKLPAFESNYKILEYLKRHTDNKNKVTLSELRKVRELEGCFGDKSTFNTMIKSAAEMMNCDSEQRVKPVDEWKIVFDDYLTLNGDAYDEEEDEAREEEKERIDSNGVHIKGLYYNHTFSYEEIDNLIEGILFSKAVDSETAKAIIDKIENNLTTKFYKSSHRNICRVREPELMDRDLLCENLRIIQRAIDDNVQISFRFNGYSYEKKLEPVRATKDTVSPYYIVANGGRYYLLAGSEIVRNQKSLKETGIWRIDLMTDIEIPNRNDKLGIKGNVSYDKQEVRNLPRTWSEDYLLEHINMSFDEPVTVRLRITSPKVEGNPKKRVRPGYTFLHDWFGDNFRFVNTEAEPPYYDIVEVKCSPFGMVNWALQYADLVEVISPESVRNEVIKKIRKLNEKYGV